jgi:hypothetical protein
VSPIFIRPVREQLEHDRLIRHLQTRYKRKFEVGINVGEEQVSPVKIGSATFFPDVVLSDGRKLAGLAEVETGESVNNLEAMAQWVHFSRARVPFHLYVPVQGYDAARRLCESNQARVSEIWTYRPAADGFDLVRMYSQAPPVPEPAHRPAKTTATRTTGRGKPAARPAGARRVGRAGRAVSGASRSNGNGKARSTRLAARPGAGRKKAATGSVKKGSAGRRR